MELKDFIGKVVIGKENRWRYTLYRIDAVEIAAQALPPHSGCYVWRTGTGPYDNAIARGTLEFEDPSLYEPFKALYESYIHSEAGRLESYTYYMLHYD